MAAIPRYPRTPISESGVFLGAASADSRLLRITGAIADAVTREQVVEAVVDQVAAALGASSAGLWLLDDEGAARLVRSVGYAKPDAFDGARLGASPLFPALDCIRRGAPVWLGSQRELLEAYPDLLAYATPGRDYRISCLPIVVQGATLGAIGLTFDQAPPLDEEEQHFLLLVARYTAQALERLRLVELERQMRNHAEAARLRAELLYRMAESVIHAEDLTTVMTAALDAIGPALGTDRSAILTFDDEGVMRFRAFRGLSESYRRAVEGHSPWQRQTQNPEPLLVRDVSAEPSLAAYGRLFEREGIGALAFVPLVAGGALIGKFMVYYPLARDLSRAELEMARGIANHVAAAVARFSALEALQRTVRVNEIFTGILGHDLRNPLGAILTAAEVASSAEPDQRLAKPLNRIRSSGARMARMIDQLLDLTRVRVGGGVPLRPAPVDIAQVIRQVSEELETGSAEPKVELEISGSKSHGVWDADRLSQVFSNLIANALQHGEQGQHARVQIDAHDPLAVRVQVQNRGVIAAKLLEKIFEPMIGGDRRHDGSHGLGLGLYISREIVRAHGGRIEVSSDQENGTCFSVTLPRDSSAARLRTP